MDIAATSSPPRAEVGYPLGPSTIVKKHAKRWMGKSKLMSLEKKQGAFDLFRHSEGHRDLYMPLPTLILLHTLYLLLRP